MNNKVVYAFLTAKDIPFYIGMGSIKRCRDRKENSRNPLWWKMMLKHPDYKFKIVDRSLTKEQAFEIEIDLIAKFGRKYKDKGGILTNRHEGGAWGESVPIPIVKFKLNGPKVERFESWEDARRSVGNYTGKSGIGMCCKHRNKSYKNHQWFYESEVGDRIFVKPIDRNPKGNAKQTCSKRLGPYILKTDETKVFKNQRLAMIHIGEWPSGHNWKKVKHLFKFKDNGTN